jgi:hypothetical protein
VKRHDGKDADEGKETPAANGSDPPEPSPFERFEAFARKVISVPKAEIDERERAYREGRAKRSEDCD